MGLLNMLKNPIKGKRVYESFVSNPNVTDSETVGKVESMITAKRDYPWVEREPVYIRKITTKEGDYIVARAESSADIYPKRAMFIIYPAAGKSDDNMVVFDIGTEIRPFKVMGLRAVRTIIPVSFYQSDYKGIAKVWLEGRELDPYDLSTIRYALKTDEANIKSDRKILCRAMDKFVITSAEERRAVAEYENNLCCQRITSKKIDKVLGR